MSVHTENKQNLEEVTSGCNYFATKLFVYLIALTIGPIRSWNAATLLKIGARSKKHAGAR